MLSYSQRSSRWCHSNSFSILIDPIITGYQEGGKRGEWGGGGVGCRRHNRLCPASSILRNWAALMVPQLRTTHMYTHSLFWRVVIKLRMLSLFDIYPSCGSSAIPIGKCNWEQLKTRLLFSSKSDTNMSPPTVQYNCNEFHSTASQ